MDDDSSINSNNDAEEGVEINPPSILKNTDEVSGEAKTEPSQDKEVSFHPAVEVTEIPPLTNDRGPAMLLHEDSEITEEPLKDPPPLVPESPLIDEDTPTMEQLYKTEGAVKSYQERKLSTEPKIVRRMNRVDIETGRIAWKYMTARPIWDFKTPMNPLDRRKEILQGLAQNQTEFDDQDSEAKKEELEAVQYRLHSKVEDRKYYFHKEFKLIRLYLHWTFRATFSSIIITDFIAFFLISWAWACAIYLGSLVSPRCFVVAGTPLIEMEDWREQFYFMDAFQLSWTTFSTVGYGIVYPNVNKGAIDARPDCFVFSFMITLESFVGVLFAAFCGSIIFGKIARIQSVASIRWSDPLVIRYGKGVVEPKPSVSKTNDTDEDSSSDSDDEDDGDNKMSSSMTDASERSSEALSISESGRSKGSKIVRYPPPVLEFRVINTLNEHHGGEIMNAELTVYASTEASKSMESLAMSENQIGASTAVANLLNMSLGLTQKTGRALQKTKNGLSKATHMTSSALQKSTARVSRTSGSLVQKVNRAIARPSMLAPLSSISTSINEEQPELQPYNKAQEINREMAMATLALAASTANNIAVDEGSGSIAPRHIFSKMEIETDTHPFFKRVWNIRHTLDEKSPLLSAKVKRIMQKNKGKWPQEICNAAFIRKNIHFHQIIVQLSGTNNSSGSDVFGMHVYEFESLNIGYRFAKMLDVNEDGKLYVDTELLNDVREQRGGGGEDIIGVFVDEFGEVLPSEEETQTPAATATGHDYLVNPRAEIRA